MPAKVYFLSAVLIGIGGSSLIWLIRRWVLALRDGPSTARWRESIVLAVFVAFALVAAFIFLPCFSLFEPVLCQGPPQQKTIALTFDDGPNDPYTSEILDVLARTHVPATFFLVGQHMVQYPQVVKRMLMEGHEIGNHTWDHRPLITMSEAEIRQEIAQWETAFAVFQPLRALPLPKFFRAPHGWKSPFLARVLEEKGYRLIGWTRGVWDSDRPGESVLFERLQAAGKNGAILLLHDGDGSRPSADRSQTAAVLPKIIDYYRQQGFRFVTVREMLGT